jgi:hypothetical protein
MLAVEHSNLPHQAAATVSSTVVAPSALQHNLQCPLVRE